MARYLCLLVWSRHARLHIRRQTATILTRHTCTLRSPTTVALSSTRCLPQRMPTAMTTTILSLILSTQKTPDPPLNQRELLSFTVAHHNQLNCYTGPHAPYTRLHAAK